MDRNFAQVGLPLYPFVNFRSYLELSRWYIDNPSIAVIGKPSAAMADRLEKETQERLAANRERFGEEGLRRLQEELEEAQKENDIAIPPEIISGFKVPSVDSIRWIDVKTARARSQIVKDQAASTKELQDHVDKDGSVLPYFVQFDSESPRVACL
jgi:Zn-dependent M16 (insulinase) family peptidase